MKLTTYEHRNPLRDAWQEPNPKICASWYLPRPLLQSLPQPHENKIIMIT
jgi:hypothetical protein